MLKVALCDDDPVMLANIKGYISAHFSKTSSNASLKEFSQSVGLIGAIEDGDRYDIYILDIEMLEADGLEVAERIRTYQPGAVIIFLTSHMEYAPEGYKVRALRYVQKLNYQESLPEALDEALASHKQVDDKSLAVFHYGNVTRIFLRDIIYIKKAHRSLNIYTTEQGVISDNRSLKDLYGILNDPRFIFTDRSYLINLDFARQIDGGWMILQGDQKVPISRPMMASVKKAVIQLCGG